MFPASPIIVIIFLILYAIAGAAIGIISGCATALITKCRPLRVMKNAAFGAMGFLAGLIGGALMPWHENTIHYRLSGGTQVTSTMNSYQHPERIAIALALILPLIYELYRFKRAVNSPNRVDR